MQKRKDNRERATSGDRDSQKENKNSNKNIEPKAVLYVPYTPNSELAKELRKVEEVMEKMSGMRMKVVEKAGIQLKRILVKTNPWAGTDCQREDCERTARLPNKTGNRRGERQDMLKEKHPL